MEARKKTHAIYITVVVVLAVVAAGLFLAHRGLVDESAQLATAHREVTAERDKLKFESVMRIDKVRALEAEVKGLKEKSADQVTSRSLEEARARSAKLVKAYTALVKEKTMLDTNNPARREELKKALREIEEAQWELADLTSARGIYTVQDGDSLSKIAVFFYHEGNRWTDIHEDNAFLIEDPDRILPGQVLVVPK